MAPKRHPPSSSSPSTKSQSSTSTKPLPSSSTKPQPHSSSSAKPQPIQNTLPPPQKSSSAPEILHSVWTHYTRTTPSRTKLIDAFMGFLVVVGGVQFLYCVVGGNYPFNAFLSGFSATVGQFVLTASLRIQSNPENKAQFLRVSPERAFADFVFGSLILHFFCVNFIN